MLKKAGLTIAVAAAGMLAVSPLAFAGGYQGGDHGHGPGHSVVHENNATNGNTSSGLVNLSDNNVNVPIQACNNDIPIVGNSGALTAALGILGNAKASNEQSRSCGDNSGSAGDTNLQKVG